MIAKETNDAKGKRDLIMKTPQERAERYERERRDASERHRRKVEQMAERQQEELLAERARVAEIDESRA